MSDDWGDLESLPEPKRGVPGWMWFCGGGCLLGLLLMAGTFVLGARFVNKGRDPELQWPKVAEILPYDERHEEFQLLFGAQLFGGEGYTFNEVDGDLSILILSVPQEDDEGVDVSVEFEDQGDPVTLTIQGREIQGWRAEQSGPIFPGAPAGGGASLNLDLTRDTDTDRFTFVIMMRTGSKEDITEEEAARFLKPFHVGPDRDE